LEVNRGVRTGNFPSVEPGKIPKLTFEGQVKEPLGGGQGRQGRKVARIAQANFSVGVGEGKTWHEVKGLWEAKMAGP
jgi:hypothetical protein